MSLPNARRSHYLTYDQKMASTRAGFEQLRNENARLKRQIWDLQDEVERWQDRWKKCMQEYFATQNELVDCLNRNR